MLLFSAKPGFEDAARKIGSIHLPSGSSNKNTAFESDFLVYPDDPLFEEIIKDQEYYAGIAWVEVPEEEGA